MKKTLVLGFLLSVFSILTVGCFQNEPGARFINKKCALCHTTKRIYKSKRTDKEWEEIIERMIRHGAKLSDSEKQEVLNYLKQKY